MLFVFYYLCEAMQEKMRMIDAYLVKEGLFTAVDGNTFWKERLFTAVARGSFQKECLFTGVDERTFKKGWLDTR